MVARESGWIVEISRIATNSVRHFMLIRVPELVV